MQICLRLIFSEIIIIYPHGGTIVYIAIIFIFILTVIYLAKIKIKIYFCFATKQFKVDIGIAGIKINIKRKSKKKVKLPPDIIIETARSIKIKYLMLNVLLGFDDPIADVFAVQLLRNIFGAVYSAFKNSFNKSTELFVKIMPAFGQRTVKINLYCIISIRIGYIIKAFVKHYINNIKIKIRRYFK